MIGAGREQNDNNNIDLNQGTHDNYQVIKILFS